MKYQNKVCFWTNFFRRRPYNFVQNLTNLFLQNYKYFPTQMIAFKIKWLWFYALTFQSRTAVVASRPTQPENEALLHLPSHLEDKKQHWFLLYRSKNVSWRLKGRIWHRIQSTVQQKQRPLQHHNREAVVIDNLQLRAASIYIEARNSLGSI